MNTDHDKFDRPCLCGRSFDAHFNDGVGCDRFVDLYETAGIGVKVHALEFAALAHNGAFCPGMKPQKRKHSNEPYIVHPIEVAKILAEHGHCDDVTQSVAYLHDVVEDCGVTHGTVLKEFGPEISEGVRYVTDVSKPSDGNRKARKAIDLDHYSRGNVTAQNVKVADLISNTRSIVTHDPNFAQVYIPEKHRMLEALSKADPVLISSAKKMVADSIVALTSMGYSLRW